MKNKIMFYSVLTLLIIVIGGYLLLGKAPTDNSGIISDSNSNTDFQKVVIGMKNYNYYPNVITVKSGEPVRIYLDASVGGCYRSFTIREFGISKYLKSSSDYIEFIPNKKGTFGFACSMGMGTGTLIVE